MIEHRVVLPGSEEVAVARELFIEYADAIGVRFCLEGFQEELAEMPGKYGPPSGRLLIAFDGDRPIGCGALRDLGNGLGELKRIYVRPEARRRGLARSLSVALLEFARDKGYRAVRLDTLRRLKGAVDLYQSLGFDFIEPYNSTNLPDIVFMEKNLSDTSSA